MSLKGQGIAWALATAAFAVFACVPRALAQSGSDKATAESLFQEARTLMAEGRYVEACPKLLASQKLDPGVGTLLNLGDCYENSGQTASAWAQFTEAEAEARKIGDLRRAEAARARAAALESRLSRLTINVPAPARIPGLEVKRDFTLIDPALWGSAMPVDPGNRLVVATAPGRTKWSMTVQVDEASPNATVEVPVLGLTAPAMQAPQPQQPPAGSAVDASVREAASEPRDANDRSLLSQWWLWAAAGGVVAVTVVVVLAASGGTETRIGEHVEGTEGMAIATLELGGP